MRFTPTSIAGVVVVATEPHRDARGFFARIFCPQEFAAAGIDFTSTQINLSRNPAVHTLRGLHFQSAPYAEAKLVRPVTGSIFDVAVDLRPESPTFCQWTGHRLGSVEGDALFIPEGCAHGFLTLEPDTDVIYQMGRNYSPGQAQGYRYDDPTFAIQWPAEPKVIGDQDMNWPPFAP